MQVIPLGTNGFFPSFGRETACYTVPFGKILIILDAGSGLFRLQDKAEKLLNHVDEVHLFLSHYHLDHTFGFYAAFAIFKGKKVTVFGPERRQVFADLTKIGYFPINFEEKYADFAWEELDEREYEISTYKIKVLRQNHRGEVSLAYRFEFPGKKTLAYVTDSELKSESTEFVSSVDLLLQEHWFSGEEMLKKVKNLSASHYNNIYYCSDGHTTTLGASLIARKAQVGRLILIHHQPFTDNKGLLMRLKLARSIFKKTALAEDLRQIKF